MMSADIVRSLGMPQRTRSIAEACAWLAQGVDGMRATAAAAAATAAAAGGAR